MAVKKTIKKRDDRKIKERTARIDRRVAEIQEKAPAVAKVVEDALRRGIELSPAEIAQYAVRYASVNYEGFYEFLKENYKSDIRDAEYVSPGAMSLAGERAEACVGIGIGAVWIWVVVSPWTTERLP